MAETPKQNNQEKRKLESQENKRANRWSSRPRKSLEDSWVLFEQKSYLELPIYDHIDAILDLLQNNQV